MRTLLVGQSYLDYKRLVNRSLAGA